MLKPQIKTKAILSFFSSKLIALLFFVNIGFTSETRGIQLKIEPLSETSNPRLRNQRLNAEIVKENTQKTIDYLVIANANHSALLNLRKEKKFSYLRLQPRPIKTSKTDYQSLIEDVQTGIIYLRTTLNKNNPQPITIIVDKKSAIGALLYTNANKQMTKIIKKVILLDGIDSSIETQYESMKKTSQIPVILFQKNEALHEMHHEYFN